ncbi:MAG: zinc ribbon domain-containing protein [Planctomycetota bacterium]|jgi:hypothetical protein
MAAESIIYECTEQAMQEQATAQEQEQAGLKKCPFCAERIQAEAIKCRYCGEFLDGSRRSSPATPVSKKWYFATGSVIMALLCLGPLALPLVWLNPRYKPLTKVFITLIAFAVTVLCMYLVVAVYQRTLSQLDALGM